MGECIYFRTRTRTKKKKQGQDQGGGGGGLKATLLVLTEI